MPQVFACYCGALRYPLSALPIPAVADRPAPDNKGATQTRKAGSRLTGDGSRFQAQADNQHGAGKPGLMAERNANCSMVSPLGPNAANCLSPPKRLPSPAAIITRVNFVSINCRICREESRAERSEAV